MRWSYCNISPHCKLCVTVPFNIPYKETSNHLINHCIALEECYRYIKNKLVWLGFTDLVSLENIALECYPESKKTLSLEAF